MICEKIFREKYEQPELDNSMKVLRKELLKHETIYDGFLASIKSAIEDFFRNSGSKSWNESELAEEILRRIIGEE